MPMPWSISEGIRAGYNNGAVYQPWPQACGHEAELAEMRAAAQGLLQENEAFQRAIAERDAAIAERDRQMGKMVAHIRELETQRNEFYQKWIDAANDLARAVTSRDRYQANGKRVKAEKLELEFVLKLPGVAKAARKVAMLATHPDHATTEGERRARTERFQRVNAAFDRIEDGS
jgi:hypothetical protein